MYINSIIYILLYDAIHYSPIIIIIINNNTVKNNNYLLNYLVNIVKLYVLLFVTK